MAKQKIMLGNEAIARGAYEAGVKVSLLIREHRVRRLARIWYSMTIFTANGRRTRKLLLRWQLAHPSAVSAQWHR